VSPCPFRVVRQLRSFTERSPERQHWRRHTQAHPRGLGLESAKATIARLLKGKPGASAGGEGISESILPRPLATERVGTAHCPHTAVAAAPAHTARPALRTAEAPSHTGGPPAWTASRRRFKKVWAQRLLRRERRAPARG
jgi:hypothetical protein